MATNRLPPPGHAIAVTQDKERNRSEGTNWARRAPGIRGRWPPGIMLLVVPEQEPGAARSVSLYIIQTNPARPQFGVVLRRVAFCFDSSVVHAMHCICIALRCFVTLCLASHLLGKSLLGLVLLCIALL